MQLVGWGKGTELEEKAIGKQKEEKKQENLETCELQIMFLHSPIGFSDTCKIYFKIYFPFFHIT